ncbi:MAG: hypothetical protein E7015_03620 [Alphaproteobacteria bacterium]|nr:hypothetical protein [Alphaproteobacteria bacterium]
MKKRWLYILGILVFMIHTVEAMYEELDNGLGDDQSDQNEEYDEEEGKKRVNGLVQEFMHRAPSDKNNQSAPINSSRSSFRGDHHMLQEVQENYGNSEDAEQSSMQDVQERLSRIQDTLNLLLKKHQLTAVNNGSDSSDLKRKKTSFAEKKRTKNRSFTVKANSQNKKLFRPNYYSSSGNKHAISAKHEYFVKSYSTGEKTVFVEPSQKRTSHSAGSR